MSRTTVVTALACVSLMTGYSGTALADGRVVDKVYHPYVQPYEQEFEYRYVYQKQSEHQNDNDMAQKLGYFLNALLGYKSSPSQGQLLAWSLTLLVLLALRQRESTS